jgi:hypothetical protein
MLLPLFFELAFARKRSLPENYPQLSCRITENSTITRCNLQTVALIEPSEPGVCGYAGKSVLSVALLLK